MSKTVVRDSAAFSAVVATITINREARKRGIRSLNGGRERKFRFDYFFASLMMANTRKTPGISASSDSQRLNMTAAVEAI